MSSDLRRTVACWLLATNVVACTSWRAQPAPPTQVLAAREVTLIRAHLVDSGTVVLENPRIERSALVGHQAGAGKGSVRAIPLDSVMRVDTKVVSAVKTVALTAGVLVGMAGVGLAALVIHCANVGCD